MSGTTREEMIQRLVAFSLEAALSDPQADWLREIFASGFSGFGAMRNARLIQEMQFRGLLPEEESADPTEDEDGEWVDDGFVGGYADPVSGSSQ